MLELSTDYKKKVFEALMENFKLFSGNQAEFARKWQINESVFSTMKTKGTFDSKVNNARWVYIGKTLGVSLRERRWKMARTEVFDIIERDVIFCKTYSKGKVFVDKCAIGKTYSALYLAKTLPNCFYVDASQAKSKIAFARALARSIGLDGIGTYESVKEDIKHFSKNIPDPIFIIDEAGDLQPPAFEDLKEYMNASEGLCGWYLMGANKLRVKITNGKKKGTGSCEEIFSRLNDNYSTAVPICDLKNKIKFYRKLLTDVLNTNMKDKTHLNEIVSACLVPDKNTGEISGLRRAESQLIIKQLEYGTGSND